MHQKICTSDVTPDFLKKLFDNKNCRAQLPPRPGRHHSITVQEGLVLSFFRGAGGHWEFFLSLDFSPESSGTLENDRIEPRSLAGLRAVVGLVVVLGHRFCGLFLRPEATKQPLVVGNYYKRLVIVALWYSHAR